MVNKSKIRCIILNDLWIVLDFKILSAFKQAQGSHKN